MRASGYKEASNGKIMEETEIGTIQWLKGLNAR